MNDIYMSNFGQVFTLTVSKFVNIVSCIIVIPIPYGFIAKFNGICQDLREELT